MRLPRFVKTKRAVTLTFFAFSILFLLVFQQDLLFRLQEQSIFLFTTDFLKDALVEPGAF